MKRWNPEITTPTPADIERAKALFFEALERADADDHVGAEERLRAALALVPDRPSVLTNLAAALFKQEKKDEALALAEKVLALDPGNAQALWIAGNCLMLLERFPEAVAALERATAASPDDAEAWAALARSLTEMKRYDAALPAYRRALAARPDIENLRGDFVHARMNGGDWAGLQADWAALLADVRKGIPAARPFQLLSFPSTPADQLACARAWSTRQIRPHEPLWHGERYDHDRIRLAYVCADFGIHPTALLMAGLFARHDRSRFETIAVATRPSDGSPIRRRLEKAFEHFVEAGTMDDAALAALLREREVDIAVDLNTHIAHARPEVFAMRPAPIQASCLIYPGTSGIDAIDYLFADRIVLPEADRPHYSESIVFMPETYFITDDGAPAPAAIDRRVDHGLPAAGFVFCCFNNGFKVTADVFEVWMRLLRAVEGSVLWLLDSSRDFSANLRREAAARGVAPARLVFASRIGIEAHLTRHHHADLFLDTFYYNAHTTACDAMWMGLPVITRLGAAFAGRVAASLLHAAGMSELVTTSTEAYEALALELAMNPAALAKVRAKLAATCRRSPLFDTARQTRQIEAAYMRMMARHRAGAPPEDFAVAPL